MDNKEINTDTVLKIMVVQMVKPTSGSHGGLITYVDNEFDMSVVKKIDNLTVREGIFSELRQISH